MRGQYSKWTKEKREELEEMLVFMASDPAYVNEPHYMLEWEGEEGERKGGAWGVPLSLVTEWVKLHPKVTITPEEEVDE